jgi:DNA-binding beta-propeller fold protein YncE
MGREAQVIARRLISIIVFAAALVALASLVRDHRKSDRHSRASPSTGALPERRAAEPARPAPPPVLAARLVGRLPAPVTDPATTAVGGGRALLMGGLDTTTVSVASIVSASATGARSAGRLPVALHDAAAASDGARAYLFGGGEPSRDGIVRVTPGGRAATVGRLPAPASDVSAARLDGSFYIVGGYTGTAPLDTIASWKPGAARAKVVAHLPKPLRYAAVAAAGHELVIAGGTSGVVASRDVYAFTPATGRVRRLGRLPQPLTHAAGVTLGGSVYVLGGRGSALGTQTRRILAIDPKTGRVRGGGRLPRALSDTGAAALGGGAVLVAGGRDGAGSIRDEVLLLEPRPATPHAQAGSPSLDVYAADRPNALSPKVRGDRSLIYVPNSASNTVDEIDPRTYRVVRHFDVGALPQHVVPSYDLNRLWVANDEGNSLTPVDPRTGKPGKPVPVTDPYNLYFTPDGRYAAVMAERYKRIDFRDPDTMRLRHKLELPSCPGVNHADFTADGAYMLASCEFGGRMVVIDVARQRLVRTVALRKGGMPQDVKLAPDGARFYVADMMSDGVWTIDARSFRPTGLIRTGAGAHGLYVSRDSRYLYVSNRDEASVSLIDLRSGRRARKWRLPAGSSPDMGGVSADGRTLWLSGRYDAEVYAINTRTGRLRRRIKVGGGPHGVCVFPQPGRYSLGHTGVFR